MSTTKDDDGEGPSALSSTAMESIKSILSTSAQTDQMNVTPAKAKLSWLNNISHEEDADIVEIEEDLRLPDRPVKTSWRQSRFKNDIDGNDALKESIASTTAKSQNVRTKPKSTNISLLSTSVAHATLEKCLLGCNNGELTHQSSTISSDDGTTTTNYSKKCKPGHVIDLLELRRLSSRGIPDEPPELRSRARAASAPVTNVNPSPDNSEHDGLRRSSTSAGNIQTPAGNPHRSYRPLVWRVLLGYLPPETDLWNEVLARDRQLYANFVNEMFSSTCPAPHEVYDEEALQKRRVEEEEHLKTQKFLKGQNVYRTDEVNGGDDNREDNGDAPETPKPDESADVDANSSSTLTPGLLSARMQQEWVRGDDDNVFLTPDGRRFSSGDDDGSNSLSRISPLCAMNTPRSRFRKPLSIGTTISEEKDQVLNSKSSCGTDEPASVGLTESMTQSKSNDGTDEITGMVNDLLLPDDMEESDDVRKDMTRSVSITTSDSGKDEAVELCRQGSSDYNTDNAPITLSPSQDLDEEENILLLDEIRKDVIRTHPDLRFYLEPCEDLGQKRYAALERILYVWAQLNKGVSCLYIQAVDIYVTLHSKTDPISLIMQQVRYVQGMNEIVGTLYFVLAHDSNEDWAKEAEADTYFLFNSIMVSSYAAFRRWTLIYTDSCCLYDFR